MKGTGLLGSIRWELWVQDQQRAVDISLWWGQRSRLSNLWKVRGEGTQTLRAPASTRIIDKTEALEEPQSLGDISGQEVGTGILAIHEAPGRLRLGG